MRYRGLTWDHPRGYAALASAAATLDPAALAISWETHPLEGFESRPIEEIAAEYDLVVLDHPHVGEAVAGGALRPVEDIVDMSDLGDAARFVGASLASYAYAGKHWALPLDAATQVMALRAGDEEMAPRTWDEIVRRADRDPVALSLAGPHALLGFFSICVALGEPPFSRDPEILVGAETSLTALDLMARITSRAPRWTKTQNPIGLLDAMASGADLALVPLIYGYVGYATASPHAVVFHNAPRARPSGKHGSTLGGTGLAITRRCEITRPLVDHLLWLVSDEAQSSFIPLHRGQPSARAAWTSTSVNRAADGFFERTSATLEDAWVRPRYRGYIGFQSAASARIRDWLDSPGDGRALLDDLQDLYRGSRRPGDPL